MSKAARKKRAKFIDDGRVVAPMNVDGMPWYTPGRTSGATGGEMAPPGGATSPYGDGGGAAGKDATGGETAYYGETSPYGDGVPVFMTRREKFAFTFGVLKAALLVTFAFVGGLLLFILFCVYVWFR